MSSLQQPAELVFIMDDVPDVAGLLQQLAAGREVHVLSSAGDGLAQMADVLAGRKDVGAIHLVSHGSAGQLQLGETHLTADNLGQHAADLARVRAALAGGADLLLYGCDAGAGQAGANLVSALAQATGADVAASTNPTGNAAQGGDWVLEQHQGDLQTFALGADGGLAGWRGLLATNVTFDFGSGSAGAATVNSTTGGYTLVASVNNGDYLVVDSATSYLGGSITNFSGSSLFVDGLDLYPGTGNATSVTFSLQGGYSFDLTSMNLLEIAYGDTNFNISFTNNSGQSFGTSVNNPSLTTAGLVSPNSAFLRGITSFTITRTDAGKPETYFGFDNITLSNINELPTFVGSTTTLALAQGASATSLASLLHASDTDVGQTLTWSQYTAPSHGTLSISSATASTGSSNITPGGTLTYAPSAGFAGVDSFVVQVSDGSATATRTITVNVTPSAPGTPVLAAGSDSGNSSSDRLTNGSTLAFSGSSDANDSSSTALVFIDKNGNGSYDSGTDASASATVSAGNWSINSVSTAGLSDGSYNVYARITSATGSLNSALSSALSITIDKTAPTTTATAASLSADTGSSASDFITGTAAQTISGTLSANLASGEQVEVSTDNGASWSIATASVGSNTWSLGTTLAASNTLKVRVADAAGNASAAYSQAYVLDITAPAAPSAPDLASGSDTGTSSTDNLGNDNTPTFNGTAESGSIVTLYDTDGTTVLGSATATGGNWSITSSTLAEGSHTITARATDTAGNVSTASSGLATVIDTSAPTGLAASTSTAAAAAASSGATLATLSASDSHAVTYALGVGNGTNDADNGSFAVSGNSLLVGGSSLTAGTYKIYLTATDAAGNVAAQAVTFTVVNAPSVSSIVRAGGAASAVAGSASSADYTVTFSESVTGVDASDFALTASGTAAGSIASVTGSGSTYTVTVNSLSGDGTLRLDLNGSGTGIANGSSVAISGGYGSGQTYSLDHTAPSVSAIARVGAQDTNASSVSYTVSFSETVTGVDASDFQLTNGGTAAGSITSASTTDNQNYTVTVGSVTGDGSMRLDLKGSGTGIVDGHANAAAAYSSGEVYTLDHTAPGVASIVRTGSASTNSATFSYTVTFGESVTGVDLSDFTLTGSGSAAGTLSSVSGSGSTYTVNVTGASGEGALRLDLNGSGTGIADTSGNGASGAFTSGESYTLDHVGPTLAIASSAASVVSGETATITFTFSEDPGSSFTLADAAVTGGTLSALAGSGTTRTATFTAGSAGSAGLTVAGGSYTDAAGNSGAGAASPALTVTSPPAPPPAPLVDGVPVTSSTAIDPQTGLAETTTVVAPIASSRVDDPNTPNATLADIPLGISDGGLQTGLTVGLAVGTGMQAEGPATLLSNSQALLDLVQRIEDRTENGSASQSDMRSDGQDFLAALGSGTRLQTATLVLQGGGAGTQLEISGSASGSASGAGTAIGMVIDGRALNAGSTVQLDNIEFAAVVGSMTLRGGAGANYVVGDNASQNIFLGAGDDNLNGGGGDDFIGSRGGNDLLDGGSGNDLVAGGEGDDLVSGGSGDDVLVGGRSTTGDWQFYIDGNGVLAASHTQAVLASGAQETVAGSELDGQAAALGFLHAAGARVVDVALLYSALGRLPDVGGLSFWSQAPVPVSNVAAQLLQSGEWMAGHGQQDDGAFLASLYQQVLGRNADADGLAFWGKALASGVSRADVLADFALGAEHRALAATDKGIAVAHAGGEGEAGWLSGSGNDRLEGGAGNDLLIGGDGSDVLVGGDGRDTAQFSGRMEGYHLLLGADGQLRVLSVGTTDVDTLSGIEVAAFGDKTLELDFMSAAPANLKEVGMLYASLLGRAADVAGLRWWLASGLEGKDLASAFAASAEGAAHAGANSDAAFVHMLYLNAGLADSAAGGAASWESYLGTHSRSEMLAAWVANEAVQAAEFRGDGLWLV